MGEAPHDWDEFLHDFHAADHWASELIVEFRQAAQTLAPKLNAEADDCIKNLLKVQVVGKVFIREGWRYSDVAYRACTAAALRESLLRLLKIKFINFTQHRSPFIDNLREARGAFFNAEQFLNGLRRHPTLRRLKALWNRRKGRAERVPYADMEIALAEIDHAIDTVLKSIAIVIAASKLEHASLASVLGTRADREIEKVMAEVQQGLPIERPSQSTFAELTLAVVNLRVTLLAFGASAVTARCRAHLYLIEGHIDYCAVRIVGSRRRRRECLEQARFCVRASRAAERKAIELWLLFPFRSLAGTATNPDAIDASPWVYDVPGYFQRRALRKQLSRSIREILKGTTF